MGRPSKLTPEVSKQITDVIAAGNYIETAAAYAGIHKDTLYDWLKRGRAAKTGIYSDFVEAVEQALAQAEVRDLAIIGKAANEVWQAAAWRLERRMPQKYGRRARVDHGTPDGKPFPVNLTFDPDKLSDDELDELEKLLAKAEPAPDA